MRQRDDLPVDRLALIGEADDLLALIQRIGLAADQATLFQPGNGPAYFGLVHMAVGPDRLGGHTAELAKGCHDAPARNIQAEPAGINPFKAFTDTGCQDIQPIRQKSLEQQRRIGSGLGHGAHASGCVTFCSMAPKMDWRLASFISMRMVSPKAIKSVRGAPWRRVSTTRCSAIQA